LHDFERKNTTRAMHLRHTGHRLLIEHAASGRNEGVGVATYLPVRLLEILFGVHDVLKMAIVAKQTQQKTYVLANIKFTCI
jgi:hypothetical protein